MIDNDLNEYLGIATTESSELALESPTSITEAEAKENISELIRTGLEAVSDCFNLARAAEDSKYYSALSSLIKTVGDLNIKAIEIDKEKQKVNNPTTVNNTLFVGSTQDLFKSLEKFKEE